MSLKTLVKDPSAVLDFVVNWIKWLEGDTIATATVVAEDGLVVDSDEHTATAHIIWLSGGTAGEFYEVVSTITTVGGRTDQRTFTVKVEDR